MHDVHPFYFCLVLKDTAYLLKLYDGIEWLLIEREYILSYLAHVKQVLHEGLQKVQLPHHQCAVANGLRYLLDWQGT